MRPPSVRRIGLGVAAAIALAVLPTLAESQGRGGSGGPAGPVRVIHAPPHVQDEVLVRFKPGTSLADKATAHAWAGGQPAMRFGVVDKLHLVRLPSGLTVKDAIKRYRQHPDVLYAEPNYIVHALAVPNDPQLGDLWGLLNTGQLGGTPGVDIDAVRAWDLTTGSERVVVAVIDSGIDYRHGDLAANMWRNEADCNGNGTDDDGNGFVDDCHGIDTFSNDSDPMDDHGHGTHVAGTIGAVGNKGTGVVGVNWTVRLMPCKFLRFDGYGTTDGAIRCLDYVRMMKDRGVNVVATNNSWGGGGFSQALRDAIDAHRQRGILFIAAAGNAASDNDVTPQYPAGFDLPNVIAVAATTRTDGRADFSNFGRHTVHLGAPGSGILSTVREDKYRVASGTSMAAPHVTGVAALLAAQDPSRDWRAIKNLILAGGDDNDALTETITGKRLNAYGALTCSGSTVLRRIRPADATTWAFIGTPVNLAALHINCANPGGAVTVTVDPGGERVVLRDDGAGTDHVAGDGIYSGQWTPSAFVGPNMLTFPDGDIAIVQVLPAPVDYVVAPTAFSYRAITGTSLDFTDDSSAEIVSPFPIAFSGSSFTRLYVGSNGAVSFTEPFPQYFDNLAPIPAAEFTTLVAPFYDDLYPWVGTGQNVFWAVTGTAPSREFVIEWRDVSHYDHFWWFGGIEYGCRLGVGSTVKLQVVFFEDRKDILFNYADVNFGFPCGLYDRGAYAGVGIQVARGRGTVVSRGVQEVFPGNPVLNDSTALLWTVSEPAALAVTPVSQAFGDVLVGSSTERVFTVRNAGGGTLTGSVTALAPFAIVSGGAFSLGAGQAQDVTVRFAPTVNGIFAGSVSVTSGAGNLSRAVIGTGIAPAPSLASLSPSSAAAGGPAFTLTVSGENFVRTSQVRWNGATRPTTFVSGTKLQAEIAASDLARGDAGGTVQVTVFTPAPGGGTSSALTFTLVGALTLTVGKTGNGGGTVTSSPGGIDCGADCSEAYAPGALVRLMATPAANSDLAGWSLPECPGAGACVVTMNAAKSLTATFTLKRFTLTVAKAGSGSGTVTSSPAGIDCGADCAETHDIGTGVTLTAAPASGSVFGGWSGCETTADTTCVVTMTADVAVTVGFIIPRGDSDVRSIPALSADLVYDRFARRIYASVYWDPTGDCAASGDCVLSIDPVTGSLERLADTEGLYPGRLAISDDGQFLYVGLNFSDGTVRRIHLPSRTADLEFSLGGQAPWAEDMEVLPGAPRSVAIARVTLDWPAWARSGIAIYDDGVARPAATEDAAAGNVIEFSGSASRLYGYSNGATWGPYEAESRSMTSAFGFSRMSVGPSGISVVDVTPGLISGGADIAFDGGLVYASTGEVIDPEARTVVGRFPGIPSGPREDTWLGLNALVRPDSTISRVFFLTWSGPVLTLHVFDQRSFALLGTLEIGGVSGGPWRLIRWGSDGLAFTDWERVYLIRSPLVGRRTGGSMLTVSRAGSGTGTVTSRPAGIDCGGDCAEIYDTGAVVTLTAAPAIGSIFAGWSGCDAVADTRCTVVLTAAKAVTATFHIPVRLTVTKAGTGSGSVTSPDGISCGGICSRVLDRGTALQLTATPDAGSTFVGWSGGGCSGTGPCAVTLTTATTVTATFEAPPGQFALSVILRGSARGTVTSTPAGIACETSCAQLYPAGALVTLTARAGAGAAFKGWIGGGGSGTGACAVPMEASQSVSATFAAVYTKPDLTAAGSIIRASDITELRSAVNTLRAQNFGLSPFTFTDPAITVGVTPARAVHVTDLRTALGDAYVQAGVSAPGYADPAITSGSTVIRAIQMNELRGAVRTLE